MTIDNTILIIVLNAVILVLGLEAVIQLYSMWTIRRFHGGKTFDKRVNAQLRAFFEDPTAYLQNARENRGTDTMGRPEHAIRGLILEIDRVYRESNVDSVHAAHLTKHVPVPAEFFSSPVEFAAAHTGCSPDSPCKLLVQLVGEILFSRDLALGGVPDEKIGFAGPMLNDEKEN